MSSLIRVVPEISKNGQCLYYRNVLFQLMYNISKIVTSLVDGSLSEVQFRSFYNPSTRSKLKSFEDMTHKTSLKCRSGDTVTVHVKLNSLQTIFQTIFCN
jgi:hypothetical protein